VGPDVERSAAYAAALADPDASQLGGVVDLRLVPLEYGVYNLPDSFGCVIVCAGGIGVDVVAGRMV